MIPASEGTGKNISAVQGHPWLQINIEASLGLKETCPKRGGSYSHNVKTNILKACREQCWPNPVLSGILRMLGLHGLNFQVDQ